MKNIIIVVFFLLLGFENCLAKEKNVLYKEVDSVKLYLHILYPKDFQDGERRPAIAFFFGGGWLSGDINQFGPQASYFRDKGLISVLVEYRVLGKHKTTPFDALSDAKTAIRFLRKNADCLGISPDSIIASGGSAGGHLAAATASINGFESPEDDSSVSCIPNALVLYNPVLDNSKNGYGYERIKKHYPRFSPLHNIRKGLPPTIIFLGKKDNLIPVSTMIQYKKEMERAGNYCDLFLYKDQVHGFFNLKKGKKNVYYEKTLTEFERFLCDLGYIK